jgi:uncharacterized phage infection (PIP) family protein YhgE
MAGRSAEAAKEIKSLINTSVERVEQGTVLVDKAGETMAEVVSSIRRVADIMGEISAASNEQALGVAQVGEAVMQMDQATQQNAALVKEMAAAGRSLKSQAGELVQTVATFKLDANSQLLRAHVRSAAPASAPFGGGERRAAAKPAQKTRPVATAAKLPPAKAVPKPAPVAAASTKSAASTDDSWETF